MSVAVVYAPTDDQRLWGSVLRHAGVEVNAVRHGWTRVYVVWNGDAGDAVDLVDFQHPEDATYLFGPDRGECPTPPAGALKVTIPGGELWAAAAAAIVLWDRRIKGVQRADSAG